MLSSLSLGVEGGAFSTFKIPTGAALGVESETSEEEDDQSCEPRRGGVHGQTSMVCEARVMGERLKAQQKRQKTEARRFEVMPSFPAEMAMDNIMGAATDNGTVWS